MKNHSLKLYAVAAIIILSVIYILPTFKITLPSIFGVNIWPENEINRGLDLQGGMHLVLEVQTEKAIEQTIENTTSEIRQLLKKEKIRHKGIIRTGNDPFFSIKFNDQAEIDMFMSFLKDQFSSLKIDNRKVDGEFQVFKLKLISDEEDTIKRLATEQALEKMRNRIDSLGVSEPDLRIQGEKRILIQLPGIENPEQAKDILQKTALLEFKMVDEENDLQSALNGTIPPGSEILYEITKDKLTGEELSRQAYLIKKRTLLTGATLTDARVQFDSQAFNQPIVAIAFNKKGSNTFARITKENVGKRLAIILDNTVYSAPNIKTEILGGRATISGGFTTSDEATALAIVLRAGSLPAPVKILEERTVGPSLGKESISQGLLSMVIGGLIVILFMLLYYKGAGLIADLALVLNILLIGAGLAAFQATLTLPGIAGIILTIGMAVDANVLIFERIREELRFGRTPKDAISAGFDRASLTILDANVTTLIVAMVLFQFGTGPIKGFAVTLSLGIISSLFTALVFSKLIFNVMADSTKITKLSI